jgi:hypothetical protein
MLIDCTENLAIKKSASASLLLKLFLDTAGVHLPADPHNGGLFAIVKTEDGNVMLGYLNFGRHAFHTVPECVRESVPWHQWSLPMTWKLLRIFLVNGSCY